MLAFALHNLFMLTDELLDNHDNCSLLQLFMPILLKIDEKSSLGSERDADFFLVCLGYGSIFCKQLVEQDGPLDLIKLLPPQMAVMC